MVEQCARGHPVVRVCGDVTPEACKVCKVLDDAESERGRHDTLWAEAEVRIITRCAQATTATQTDAQKLHLREQAQAELRVLVHDFEAKHEVRERRLAVRLDAAALAAQEAVAAAAANLIERQEEDRRRMEARVADTAEHLLQVEQQMEEQRANARAEEAAEMLERARKLQELHEALVEGLRADEAAAARADAAMPRPELVEQRLEEVRKMAGEAGCAICMEELSLLEGVLCRPGGGHFVCKDCFNGHVRSEAEKQEFNGDVCCPFRSPAMGGCESAPYAAGVIARCAEASVFELLNKKRLDLREVAATSQMQREYDERLRVRMEQFQAQQTLQAKAEEARQHILQDIMTLKCPRQGCGQAFVDFEGCFALRCSRPSCKCGFCAWCLEDCGQDAHAHIRTCSHKLNDDPYFGTRADFEKGSSVFLPSNSRFIACSCTRVFDRPPIPSSIH
eukprot:1255120-Rhodomonas_salina.1